LREGDERRLQNKFAYPYDYGTAYLDDSGYYIVEGVRVLPKNDPVCDYRGSARAPGGRDTDGLLGLIRGNYNNGNGGNGSSGSIWGGGNRHLEEQVKEERKLQKEEDVKDQRVLAKSKAKSSYYDDYYYGRGRRDQQQGKGNGRYRGMMRGRGKGKGKGKGKGRQPPCRPGDRDCLPPIIPCPGDRTPAPVADIVTPAPSPTPTLFVLPTCPDGVNLGPRDPENCGVPCKNDGSVEYVGGCVNFCPPPGQPAIPEYVAREQCMLLLQKFTCLTFCFVFCLRCVISCPNDGSLPSTWPPDVAANCLDVCCPFEICELDGYPAPINDVTCLVPCPDPIDDIISQPIACTDFCPIGPSTRPVDCVDICPTDGRVAPPGCRERCCPVAPTSAPTVAPTALIIPECPEGPRPVFEPPVPGCEDPTPVPTVFIVGPPSPQLPGTRPPNRRPTRPGKGKGKGKGYGWRKERELKKKKEE
jgi:hypothetical protein